ncbi:MAG: HlyD family efflux transporter periplasmic adaptor subunit [Vicinamibacterales bacterium]
MVDIARPASVARNKKLKQAAYGVAGLTAILLVTVFVSRLKPAAPSVERATVWIDTVKRGPMVRQVRGTGTLVPEDIRWIPATTDGRVERIVLRPGAQVTPTSVILELTNPELQQSLLEARLQLEGARATLQTRRAELHSQLLNQEGAATSAAADASQARLQAEADAELAKDGLTAEVTMKISTSRAANLESRHKVELQRLDALREQIDAQLAVQAAEVNRLQTMYDLRARQVAELQVRAGFAGVLQVVPVEEGARVTPGTNLARVANPSRLKAELRIAETQAKDIQIGQVSQVDTRNGVIPGRVSRIDPASQNGTVLVDVALEGELPKGARPDLTVDGTVELERLDSVVFVGRPAFGQEHSTVGLFKLTPNGEANRVQVKLGRSSVNTIEIVEGLVPGDEVILSDMSQWDAFDRVRLGS